MTLSQSRISSANYNQNWSIPGFDQHSAQDDRELISGQSFVAQTEKGKVSHVDNSALQAYAYQNDDFMSNESYERMMRAINSHQKNKDIIANDSQNIVNAKSNLQVNNVAKESAKLGDNYVAYAGNLLSKATKVTIKEDTGHTSKDLEHKLERELAQNHVHGSVINPETASKQESSQEVEIEDQASSERIRIVRSTPKFMPTMRVKRSGSSEQEHIALVAAGLPYGLSAKQVANIVAIAKSNPEEQVVSNESVDNTLLLKSSSTRIVSNSTKAIEEFVAGQEGEGESVVSDKPSADKDSPTTVITQYTGGFVSSKGNTVESINSIKADNQAIESELVEQTSEEIAVDVQESESKEQELANTQESVDTESSTSTDIPVNEEESVDIENSVSEQEAVADTQQESSANLESKEEAASGDSQNTPKGEFEDVSLSDGATIVTLAKGQSLESKAEKSDVSTVIVRTEVNNVVKENTKDKDVSALGVFTTEDVADRDTQAELNPLAGVSADTELVDNSNEVLEPVSDVGSSKEQETVVSAVLAEALGSGVGDTANLDEGDDKPSRRRGRRRKTR